jgi:hypothetical protein
VTIITRRMALAGAVGFLCLLALGASLHGLIPSVDPDAVDFSRVAPAKGRVLLCPRDLCAEADGEPPLFSIPAARLTEKLRAVALSEARTREVPLGVPNQLRFVQVSPVLRLEDVIDVRIIPRSSGASTLALLGRPASSLLDFGKSEGRLQRWIEGIAR